MNWGQITERDDLDCSPSYSLAIRQRIEHFSEAAPSAAKRAWARLIKQVYEVDPLVCARCGGPMRIIAFIEQPEVIEQILAHLGLCSALSLSKGPAPAHSPPAGVPVATLAATARNAA
jgi:hypothetical protein